MKSIKEHLLRRLKAYPAEKRKIELLRFEQQNLRRITPEEVLETMASYLDMNKLTKGPVAQRGKITGKIWNRSSPKLFQKDCWQNGIAYLSANRVNEDGSKVYSRRKHFEG